MSGLRERLGRLTRSGEGASSSGVDRRRERDTKRDPSAVGDSSAPTRERAAWESLGFTATRESGVLVREVIYTPESFHGPFRMADLTDTAPALAALSPKSGGIAPEDLLFLDTETTGLGQGAGNVPFLVGVGWYEHGGFTVRQYVIRHPGEEAEMLAELSSLIDPSRHLVTYNGRAFDWPLLKNRYVMNRLPVSKDPEHFDFLYPARSLWRSTMPSCRLGAVEEAKLGIVREDDIPGSLAPALYFQYLAERNPAVLEGVVRHNERDILSLLALAVHFGRLLQFQVPLQGMEGTELLRLGLWYERIGFLSEAECVFETLRCHPPARISDVLYEAALFYKRRKKWDAAIEMWKRIAESSDRFQSNALDSCIELAMVYEHHYKNPMEALRWTEEALRNAQERLSWSRTRTDSRLRAAITAIQKRRERLLRKRPHFF